MSLWEKIEVSIREWRKIEDSTYKELGEWEINQRIKRN